MNIALRNVPEDLHAELKAAAKRNHRSLNGEILARLALSRRGSTLDVDAFLGENVLWHQRFAALDLSPETVRSLRDEGRDALLKRITERQKAIGKIDFDPGMIREMRDSSDA